MQIGYARVSGDAQDAAAGCEKIYRDSVSGIKGERPGLAEAMDHLRAGDTLVVRRLDRLGRSLSHLIDLVKEFEARGVGFRSLTESIDTTTNGGKLIFHVFGAIAEFERGLIRERTNAGLAAARARGRMGGRPRAMTENKAKLARQLYADKSQSITDICETLGISPATLYRYVGTKQA